ncbi:Sex-determining fem-1 [Fusarium beomiforme]|uniref:Sex-determining fem-1 n=1 Tax=Fusarium beomiforme TaxID=44412 RepID=A0A9P5DMN3_9HYPO|nr:Sex-determining fem-1 [Fusarium beomiforme]
MVALGDRPTKEQWVEYKSYIRNEYLNKNTPLKCLVASLKAQGLQTTRKQQGKLSEVVYRGSRIQKSKLIKETLRYRETDIYAQMALRSASPLNPELVVCTPPSLTMDMRWPDSLPWLSFRGIYDNYPNCGTRTEYVDHLVTPIGRAIKQGHVDLVELLLRFNARIDDRQAQIDGETVIEATLRGRGSDAVKLRLLNVLYRHYDSISLEDKLFAAIQLRDMVFIKHTLYENTDMAIAQAAWQPHNATDMRYLLVPTMEVEVNSSDPMSDYSLATNLLSESVTAEVFIAAALAGDCETVRRLHEIRPVGDEYGRLGFTSLQAAVRHGRFRSCELLLELYGGASAIMLLSAAYASHEDILKLLLSHGADFNARVKRRETQSFYKLHEIRPGHRTDLCVRFKQLFLGRFPYQWGEEELNCLIILLNSGARLIEGDVARFAEHWLEAPLKAALAAGGNPDDRSETSRTPIQCAIHRDYNNAYVCRDREKRLLTVQALVQAGASLRGGEVVSAIRTNDQDLITLLLQYKGTLKDIDHNGASCLEANIIARKRAIWEFDDSDHSDKDGKEDDDDNDLLQQMLEAQEYDIDAGPFCAAMETGDWALVDRLFARGHNENGWQQVEGTAVGLAARYGRFDVLEKLLSRFARSTDSYSAILPMALNANGSIRCDRIHVAGHERYCGRIDYWRRSHRTTSTHDRRVRASPLALAVLGCGSSGFRELLKKGFLVDDITLTVITFTKDCSEYLEVLKEYQPRLDHRAPCQTRALSPLSAAISRGNDKMARFLVEAGMNVNEHDVALSGSLSPLQCAVRQGNLGMVGYLLESGANVNAPPAFVNGATALQWAVAGGYIGLANQLLQARSRVNARGVRKYGRTALEAAARRGNLDMLELLICHGAARSRNQVILAVKAAGKKLHYAAAEWLKYRCGWSKEDELKLGTIAGDHGCINCREMCCDEIHDSETECIHDYSAEEEEHFAVECRFCNYQKDCDEEDISKDSTNQDCDEESDQDVEESSTEEIHVLGN